MAFFPNWLRLVHLDHIFPGSLENTHTKENDPYVNGTPSYPKTKFHLGLDLNNKNIGWWVLDKMNMIWMNSNESI